MGKSGLYLPKLGTDLVFFGICGDDFDNREREGFRRLTSSRFVLHTAILFGKEFLILFL